MMLRKTLLTAALAALMPVGMAHAVKINLDLHSHATPVADGSGIPSLQNLGDQWNYHTSGAAASSTALNDVTGAASGVTFTLLNNGTDGWRGDTGAPRDDMARDYYFATGADGLLSKLSGLDASGATTYDIYVVSADNWAGSWADIHVTHAGGTELKQLTSNVSTQYNGGDLIQGLHYEVFLGITADAAGEIGISTNDYDTFTGNGYLSGLQLVTHAVPEPTTLMLVGLGCMVSFVTRRRS